MYLRQHRLSVRWLLHRKPSRALQRRCDGLVFVRTSDTKEAYRRVGTFWIGFFSGDDSGSNWQRAGFVESTMEII